MKAVSGGHVLLATAKNGREENQDRVIYAELQTNQPDRRFALAAIFDGIGGMIDGGKCANMAIVSILSQLLTIQRTKGRIAIIEAMNAANAKLWSKYKGRGGTTFAGLFFESKRQTALNTGDSRVYSYNVSRGLSRHSVDDKLGNQLAKMAGLESIDINPEIADRLGQYLGMQGPIRPNIFPIKRTSTQTESSRFLLTTDGIHSISDCNIENILRGFTDPRSTATSLLEAGRSASSDNGTVAILDSPTFEPSPDPNFECIRIWSTEGCFSFSFQTPKPTIRNTRLPQKIQPSESPPPPRQQPPTFHSKSAEPSADEEQDQGNKKQPRKAQQEVQIEQLTFDQIPEDESPT